MANYKPYVDPKSTMKELTAPAIVVGIFISIIMGAANAYLGLKAGMTVAATFPAAVIAMAVLRAFKGTILEENIARTTGAVGEALAAGAIFTIPAFIITGVWTEFDYTKSTILMLVGGILGVLFTILLRRTFTDDTNLPFPESQACNEIVKAGQKGSSGAGTVFTAMGIGALIQILIDSKGIPLIGRKLKGIFTVGDGAFPYQTPAASAAFLGVGFIIGPRLGAITFAGGVFGWLFLMPLVLSVKSMGDAEFGTHISTLIAQGEVNTLFGEFGTFYGNTIKKVAIGAMIVSAFYTLFNMRKSLITGIQRSFGQMTGGGAKGEIIRTERDLNFSKVLMAIAVMVMAMVAVYYWLTASFGIALIVTLVMAVAGFLFAAVAGYLVGIIGSSSNPISGLTLSTLLIAAGLLYLLNMRGEAGVAAVLGVATVVCCIAGVAGDMLQDWKVGHLLGGTPWRMQIGGLIGVVAAALVMVLPIMLLHEYGGGIGSEELPAPQAGLMATMAQGIIGGELEWSLVIIGMFFAAALIMIGAPAPMLIAVGMYLPFETTGAIFVGGLIKWILTRQVSKHDPNDAQKEAVENRGLLVASGLVAGEALLGIILAGIAAANIRFFCAADAIERMAEDGITCYATSPSFFGHWGLGILTIVALGAYMVMTSMKGLRDVKGTPPGGGSKSEEPGKEKKKAKEPDKPEPEPEPEPGKEKKKAKEPDKPEPEPEPEPGKEKKKAKEPDKPEPAEDADDADEEGDEDE